VSETSLPFEPAPQESLRLVANPFLAMSGLLLWFAVMQLILSGAAGPFTILAVLLALASLALLPALLHYHCLDCGRTGPLLTWKRHLCPRVVARRFEGRSRRLRGPTPTVQVVLWLWIYVQFLWIWHQASRGN
jgi:hypothetical protein